MDLAAEPRECDRVLGQLAALQAERREVKGALATIARIESDSDRAQALAWVAGAQAHNGDVRGARRTAARIRSGGILSRAEALQAIAVAQAKAGDVSGALRTADEVQSILASSAAVTAVPAAQSLPAQQRALTLSRIAAAQAEAGDVEGALRTLESMKDAPAAARCVWDEREVVRCVILSRQALARSDAQAAVQTVASSPELERSLVLVRLYLDLVAAVAAARDDAVAAAYLALQPAAGAGEDARLLLAQKQADVGDVGSAARGVDALSSPARKARLLSRIAVARAKAGDRAGATETLAAAHRLAGSVLPGQPEPLVPASGTGPEALAKLKLPAGVAEAAAKAAAAQQTLLTSADWALLDIAGAEAELGDLEAVLRTGALITQSSLRAQALRGAATAFLRAGDIPAARLLYAQVYAAAGPHVLPLVLTEQARAGDVEGALAFAQGQADPIVKAKLLIGVARGAFERNDDGTAGK